MKSQSALVRPKGAVELHAEATIDLHLAFVVFPGDAKLDDAFGDSSDFEGGAVFGVGLEEGAVFEGGGELFGAVSWRFVLLSVCSGGVPLYACSNSGSETLDMVAVVMLPPRLRNW